MKNNNNSLDKFSINNLSKKQLTLISKSLEFYTRYLFWQIDNIPDDIRFKNNLISEKNNDLLLHLKEIKKILFPELANNSSYWVWNYNNVKSEDNFKLNGQIWYELYKDINKFIYDSSKNNDYYDIDSQEPLRYSTEWKIIIKQENINNLWFKNTKNSINNDIPF